MEPPLWDRTQGPHLLPGASVIQEALHVCCRGNISLWGIRGSNEVALAHRGIFHQAELTKYGVSSKLPALVACWQERVAWEDQETSASLLVASVLTRSQEIPRLTPPSPGLACLLLE